MDSQLKFVTLVLIPTCEVSQWSFYVRSPLRHPFSLQDFFHDEKIDIHNSNISCSNKQKATRATVSVCPFILG
jgi:hypothetical protein